jgi:protein-disulfide isomerase
MIRSVLAGATIALIGSMLCGATLGAPASTPKSFSDAQRAEIGQIVRDYLVNHPEVLVDAMNALQAKQDAETKAKADAVIKQNPAEIYNDGYSFVAGNPKAKVTLVEFFDYNCGYCRKAFAKMMTLAKPDSDVKFIFKEYPILSPESEVCSRAAFAAAKQGKYLQFHKAMMSHQGRANDEAITEVAKQIGLNLNQLHKDMNDPAVLAHVEQNLKLGNDLGMDGTPSFIVNGQIIDGWSEADVDKAITKGEKS